ncbi:hypothetical protein HNP84_008439 [Thermocatellispora tengchongensis]|uniref:Uncharacterized protein n=1 Tax=Thermocatellispora tengchongensis TaxID=1073253 RepID=A0A840PLK6_9ACTN|nr:hypothetical protein [Thermocatellispora tengchongensis]
MRADTGNSDSFTPARPTPPRPRFIAPPPSLRPRRGHLPQASAAPTPHTAPPSVVFGAAHCPSPAPRRGTRQGARGPLSGREPCPRCAGPAVGCVGAVPLAMLAALRRRREPSARRTLLRPRPVRRGTLPRLRLRRGIRQVPGAFAAASAARPRHPARSPARSARHPAQPPAHGAAPARGAWAPCRRRQPCPRCAVPCRRPRSVPCLLDACGDQVLSSAVTGDTLGRVASGSSPRAWAPRAAPDFVRAASARVFAAGAGVLRRASLPGLASFGAAPTLGVPEALCNRHQSCAVLHPLECPWPLPRASAAPRGARPAVGHVRCRALPGARRPRCGRSRRRFLRRFAAGVNRWRRPGPSSAAFGGALRRVASGSSPRHGPHLPGVPMAGVGVLRCLSGVPAWLVRRRLARLGSPGPGRVWCHARRRRLPAPLASRLPWWPWGAGARAFGGVCARLVASGAVLAWPGGFGAVWRSQGLLRPSYGLLRTAGGRTHRVRGWGIGLTGLCAGL